LALVLDPQLSKLPVARRRDVGRVRKTKVQPLLFEETATRGDAVHQQRVSVVLCADVEASSSATQMFDDLGFGTKTVHYDVELAFRADHRRGRRLQGFGNFGDLRQLCLDGVES